MFDKYMTRITDLCSFSKKKYDLGPKDYRSMQKRHHFTDLCAKDVKITDACPTFTDICSIPNIYRYMHHCWNYLLIALIYGLPRIQWKHNAEMVWHLLCFRRQIWIQIFNNCDLTLSTLSVQFTLWGLIRNEVIGYTTEFTILEITLFDIHLGYGERRMLEERVKSGCQKNTDTFT